MESKSIYVLGRRVIDMFYSKGFADVKIQFETGPAKGEGVVGQIFHAKISAVKEGAPQEFEIVIKCAPTDATIRKTMPVRNLFLREALYYNKIVPIYDNLQDQFELCVPHEMRCFLPKCYEICDEFGQEMIILEDLTKKGFRVAPLQTVDYEHAVIMLQNIAKLHSLSFIYEQRYPKRFREMADQCGDPYTSLPTEEFVDTYMSEHGEKSMKQFTNAITDASLRKRFEIAVGTNAYIKHRDIMTTGKILVILHGDNWHNNHLFKYKNGKPTEAIPLDFQWARYGSIAYDFMYLFFRDSGELRRNSLHQLIDVYYAELKGFLSLCGYDANKFCTYEQFKDELKSVGLLNVVIYMLVTPLFKNPELSLPEILAAPATYVANEEYIRNVNDMVTDWANVGLF